MRAGTRWLVLAAAACAATGAAHAAENRPAQADLGMTHQPEGVVKIVVDFVRTLVLARPAGTLIIGNPAIAQATLSDDKTIVLTGRSPGLTNLIVLGADGAELANVTLDVAAAGGRLITVDEGDGRAMYSCSGRCELVRTGEAGPPPPEAAGSGAGQ
ncbi:pilus assembly protein N-terminal domain-containing protein [Ensifer aridi]|uniref:pilus assembly protein N-terminal domain-containing protein n=1 Tax=Ensifer aridi TaxID=1708715 RepID=UPI0003FC78B6|nr:pilus assembly protein N-terminal domain-containing protein [Ensifer aridi]